MARIFRRIVAPAVGLALLAACRPAITDLRPDVYLVFADCRRAAGAAASLVRYLADDAFEVLDRTAAARMTGSAPAHAIDVVAVDARDDVIEIVAASGPPGGGKGATLEIRTYRRPDLVRDVDVEARLVAYVEAEFGCALKSAERAEGGSVEAESHQRFARRHRHLMSRYR